MSFRLTAREGELLVRAATTFASPLVASSLDEWRGRCNEALAPLFKTERAAGIYALPGEPIVVTTSAIADAADAWGGYYYKFDTALLETGRAVSRRVYHLSDLYNYDRIRPSAFWNEWVVPYGILNAFGMSVEVPACQVPVSLHAYPTLNAISARRGRALLRLLHPAFTAGVHAAAQTIAAHGDVLRSLETTSEGVLMVDFDGTTRHVSPRLALLLADPQDGLALSIATKRVAERALAVLRPAGRAHLIDAMTAVHGMTERVADFHIRAIVMPMYTGSGDPHLSVVVTRTSSNDVDDATLAARFQLTPRECMIARAIAMGDTSHAIADRLEMSVHTVRRHTERIFAKLKVSSRSAVGPRLTGSR